MEQGFTILIVCSANVCRSPLTAQLLQRWAREQGLQRSVHVQSAGVAAFPGEPMCPQAAAYAGADPLAHTARELAAGMLIDADLILTADRVHRGAAARLVPQCRSRLFTLRQAAGLADALRASLAAGALPEGAPPLPEGTVERLEWLVREMDAARGLLAARPEDDDDVPDRHGLAPHAETFDAITAAVADLTGAVDTCLAAPDQLGRDSP